MKRSLGALMRLRQDAEFQASLFEAERSRSIVSLSVGAVLYLLFVFLDAALYPEFLVPLMTVRVIVVFLLVSLIAAIRRATTYQTVVRCASVSLLATALGIALMCHMTTGVSSPYYAGIAFSFVFVAALLTWPPLLTLAVFATVLTAYYAPFVFRNEAVDTDVLGLNSAFLLGTAFLVILGMSYRTKLAWEVYSNRRELSRRNRELAHLHELKDRMFQNVSHELRTPLTMMLIPLQRKLGQQLESEEGWQWTKEMYSNGLRLLKQINDLLDLATLDTRGIVINPRPVDVRAVIGDLLDDLRPSAEAASITMSHATGQDPLVYAFDPHHLERIFLNLLGNSVKFTPPGGKVTVAVEETSRGLEIAVEDTGPGIPQDQQKKIFDRFQQVEGGTTRHLGGSGIGLALVDELVELMGGEVWVQSEEGHGSKFIVRFPLDLAAQESSARQYEREPLDEADLYRRADREVIGGRLETGERMVAGVQGARVLIAEDDDRLRQLLVEILSGEYRVVAVSRGEEALREALVFRPQVVVSDVMMPGMDGVELCRRLRERAELKGTSVVLLTAKGSLEDRIEGRKVGADSYLTKPFDLRELLATIEGLLRSRMHLVGEYLVQSPLGRGGQGDVWLAEHRSTGDRVALKVIRPSGLEDETARARLRREHETLVRLEHPNIVRIVARGEQAGGLFLAMEFLEGVTLDQLIRSSGALPFEAVAAIGRSTAAALSHVHMAGLVHRDVKCSNVMLLREVTELEKRVRLIDFGTAAAVQRVPDRSRRVVGSLPYLAPELLCDTAIASFSTDVFGLGVVMYRLATGILPFKGSTAEELVQSIERGPELGLDEAAPDIPRGLAAVIERAIAREPAARWPTARELERSLARFPASKIEIAFPAAEELPGRTVTFSRASGGARATTTG